MSVSTASNGAINIYLTGGALDRAEKMLAGIPGGTEKAVKSAMSRAVSNMRSGYVKEVQKNTTSAVPTCGPTRTSNAAIPTQAAA
ncbi:MAG: hypothetical protein ACLRYE_11625 [Gemmiger formicilis]|uniref:hypothetical protein n=1 Tax=Gemmiger formicilis TaxID=745368 RepID=UPI0039A3C95E